MKGKLKTKHKTLNTKYCRAGGEGQFLEFKILIGLGIKKNSQKTDFITDDSQTDE